MTTEKTSKVEVRIRIAGIDLAWGEREPDGVCVLEASARSARVINSGLTHGDDELLGGWRGTSEPARRSSPWMHRW